MDIEEMLRYVQVALQKAIEAESERLYQQAMEMKPLVFPNMQAFMDRYPTWNAPESKIVEGSIVHPVSDPARLIGVIQQFDYVYNPDGTCTNWYCGKPGVVLAYDSFSPEIAHWFCASCWQQYEQDDMPFLDIVHDRRD